jgi:hypothetical protein
MDFTWVTSDDANAIQNSIVNAKGDLIGASANDTPAILSVGNNGETLVADSSTSTGLGYTGGMGGGRNFIVNGAFDIDQRNNGASVTPANATYYPDRWVYGATQASKITAQRITSTIAGFPFSFKVTSSSAYTPTANDEFEWITRIEDKNIVNLAWGTASAKSVTLSFWVKSSLTGTFAGSIVDGASAYSYPFTYSISAANTAEYKRITIAGPTAGNWSNAGIGIQVLFSMGAAGTSLGTPGAWVASFKPGATGQTNLVATSGATWEITGIQFELGSSPTTFSRAGGTIQGELAACMRYFQRITSGADSSVENTSLGFCRSTTTAICILRFVTTMRTAPSLSFSNLSHFALKNSGDGNLTPTAIAIYDTTVRTTNLQVDVASGVVAGNATRFGANSASATLDLSAEL